MVTVAITGAAGLVGRRVVAELDADPDVERLLGFDIDPPTGLVSRKLELQLADVRDVRLDRHLTDADVLVHLAFVLDPRHDADDARTTNLDGTRNALTCAVQAGVRRIVLVSSAAVYGAHPDNDIPLTEDSPLRANPGFPYAEHKLELERWVDEWLAGQDDPPVVTILRPTIVAGPGVENAFSRMLEAPRMASVRGHKPPWQFVHVDDLATAIAHAATRDLPGAYNVSSEGWLAFDEVTAIAGRKVVDVGEEVAFQAAGRLWSLGLGEVPPGAVHYAMHPWVLSVDKLVETGWQPKRSNRDALAELVDEHRDWVSLGPVRTHRSTLRQVGTTAAALLGLVALVRLLRGGRR